MSVTVTGTKRHLDLNSSTLTTTGNITAGENIILGDSQYVNFGTGNDLRIQHTGSESQIFNTTGQLDIRTPSQLLVTSSGGENMIKAVNNGAVTLYHDNSVRFETGAAGSQVTGNFYLFSGNYIHFDNGVTNNYAIRKSGTTLQFKTGGTYDFLSGNASFEGIVSVTTGKAFRMYNAAGTGWGEIALEETANKIQFNRGIQPSGDNQSDQLLGTSSKRWYQVHAGSFHGDGSNLTGVTATDSTKLPLAGGTMSGAINMNNNNISGVNAIQFADPGPSEGVTWTNTKIFESPNDLTTNTSGNLQLVYNNTRRLTVDSSGIDVNGNIVVSGTVDGRDVAADGTKLDTIDTNADVTPTWVPSSNPNYLTSSSTQSKYLRSDTADTATGKITLEGNSAAWNTTTPGLTTGSLHFDPGVGTDHFGNAITFGASDSSNGTTAQAGIYLRTDGSYGSRMYFATTDSYASGSKVAMYINNNKDVYFLDNINVAGDIVVSGTVDGVDIAALATANTGDQDLSGLAPKASPALTGNPTAPTQAAGNNSTRIATTAFVSTAVSNLVGSAPGTLDTLQELGDALGDDPNFATTTATSLGNRVRVDTASQGLSSAEKSNARTNIGAQVAGSYAAASHNHAASEITSGTLSTDRLDSSVIFGNNSSGTNEGNFTNWNTLSKTGFYSDDGATGKWNTANWSSVIHFKLYDDNNNYASQLGFDTYNADFFYRMKNNGTWTDWYEVYHEGHKPTYSELGAMDYSNLTGTVPTWNQNTTGSAATLTTARTITIGSTGKTFNGSGDVSWTLSEIGAQAAGSYAAASHNHDDRYYTETESDAKYLLNTTDTLSGNLTVTGNLTVDGTTFGLYHGTVEDDYYFDSYNGSKHLAMIVKNSRSDIIRYQSIDNLEYWNGSSWQDMTSQLANVKKLLDGRQDTMWAVPETYYKFRFTVSPSTVWPLQAKIGQQLSWSGSSYPGSTITVEEDANDGNGFQTLVTADFGGVVGGSQTPLNSNNNGITNWGLMFKADSALHTGKGSSQRTRITVDYYGWTPSNNSHVTIPLQNLFITSNYAGTENTDYTNLLDYDRNITVAGNIVMGAGKTVDGVDVSAIISCPTWVPTTNPNYLTDYTVTQADVTQHVGAIDHDSLLNFVANEHIDWTASQTSNIHADNYTNTTYSVGDGGLTQNNLTNALKSNYDAAYTYSQVGHLPLSGGGALDGGVWNFDTNTNSDTVNISRSGSNASQVMKIGITDTVAEFNYIEDTTSEGNGNFGQYIFKLGGNNGETTVSALNITKTGISAPNLSGTNTGDQDLSSLQPKPSEGAFADGDKTKLDGIATGADVTPSWVPSSDPGYGTSNLELGTTSTTALAGNTTIPSGNQIIDWTTDQGSTNIHSGNYNNTQLSDSEVIDAIIASTSISGVDKSTIRTNIGAMSVWNMESDDDSPTSISSSETATWAGGTNITTTRSGNTITINSDVTNVSQLTNDAGYITSFDITTQTDPKYIRSNANDVVTGNTTWNDSNQARFGTGGDLKIQHNGTNSYIDNHTGNLYIRNNATSDLGKDIFIQAKSGEASIYAFDDADVELYYNNSKKFSTTSTGFECNGTEIDTSSNGGGYKIGFNVSDNFSFSGYDVAHYGISNAGNDTGGGIVLSGYYGIRFAAQGNIRGHISQSGVLTMANDVIAFGSPSDISLKENIKPIDNALEKVNKLKGVTFKWKEAGLTDLKEDIGFIAQDVQEVLPELVRENDNGKLSLRDKGIVPVLVEAIKELKAEIDELKKCNKCKNCNCND